jgi:ubiquinone/menaquinone biosynthesis C-methylase UbiE
MPGEEWLRPLRRYIPKSARRTEVFFMNTTTHGQRVLEKLAASLTARTTELIPFLPYLLQDLWELGTPPHIVADLIKGHIDHPEGRHFLDLACGKGAVSVRIAEALGARVTGIDITPEFVDCARDKAEVHGVASLCAFMVADVNTAVREARGYDGVIFAATGDILGSPEDTLKLLGATVREHGFIIIDEAYLDDTDAEVRYQNYAYLTRKQWLDLFERSGLRLLEEVIPTAECAAKNKADLEKISARAAELTALHPEKKELFEGYVASQADEGQDLESTVVGVVWILRKM